MEEQLLDFGIAPASGPDPVLLDFALLIGILLFITIAIVVLIYIIRRLLTRPEMMGLTREEIQKRWEEIESISNQGVMGGKMAIVEADTLLDSALKSIMMPGATLGERLKVAQYKYPELRNVWFAHKLRNQLVHEATFNISKAQVKSAMHEYKRALRTLNVL